MYYYILDPHNIPQKDFERQQTELQSLLTEFKINGEMARVTPLRTIAELVDTASNRGATTLVACGTDETFNQMLVTLKDRDFTLAFIPLKTGTQLGKILGMNDLATCAKTIAGRRIEKIDAARINGSFFISYLEIGIGTQTNRPLGIMASMKLFTGSLIELKMRIDGSYYLTSKVTGALLVNTRGTKSDNHEIGNPQDGYLDLLMIEKLTRFSAAKYKSDITNGSYENISNATSVRCKKVEFLEPHGLRIYIDGNEVAKAPSTVEIFPNKIRMIVGKNRTF